MRIKVLLIVFLAWFSVAKSSAQSGLLEIYSGVARSDFDFDNWTRAHAVPIGMKIMYGGSFKLGLDLGTNAAYPFSFIAHGANDKEIYRDELDLIQANLFVLVEFNQEGILSPFLRAGGGIYTGKISTKKDPESNTVNLGESFGYNYGAGLIIGHRVNAILEFSLYNTDLSSDSNSNIEFSSNWYQLSIGLAFEF